MGKRIVWRYPEDVICMRAEDLVPLLHELMIATREDPQFAANYMAQLEIKDGFVVFATFSIRAGDSWVRISKGVWG